MIKMAQRFIITDNCNTKCPHCFNSVDRKTKNDIDADILIKYMRKNSMYLKQSDFKMMGGEPTIHSRFYDIVKEALKHYGRRIKVYTNGIKMSEISSNEDLLIAHFKNRLMYIINGYTFNFDKFKEYEKYINFVAVHTVITTENIDEIIEKTIERSYHPKIQFVLSPNSQVNIFDEDILNDYRSAWMKALIILIPHLRRLNKEPPIDHFFPLCFYTEEMIEKLRAHDMNIIHRAKIGCCAETSMGLTDWNFDFYYCNQTRIKLGSVLNDDGEPKDMKEMIDMINNIGTRVKVNKIMELSDKCKNCNALMTCKLGCFYNKLNSVYGDRLC